MINYQHPARSAKINYVHPERTEGKLITQGTIVLQKGQSVILRAGGAVLVRS